MNRVFYLFGGRKHREKDAFIRVMPAALERRLGKKVSEMQFRKLGSSYAGLSLSGGVSAVYNVDKAYDEFQEGRSLLEIFKEAMHVLCIKVDPRLTKLDFIKNYDEAKKRLFLRVSNHDHNVEYLKDVPHVDVMNLSITFHMLINDDGSSLDQVAVTNEIMTSWGIDLETLYREATISSEHLLPVILIKENGRIR